MLPRLAMTKNKIKNVWKLLLAGSGIGLAFCYGLLVGAKKIFPYYHIDKIKKRFDGSYSTDAEYSHGVIDKVDPESEFDVHFIHVNRNCHATLIRVTGGPNVMIGCGPLTDSRVILNYLRKLKVNSIDKVIIPYYDRDFVGGLKPLLNEFLVSEFILEEKTRTPDRKKKVEATIENKTIVYPNVGEEIEITGDIILRKFGPAKTFTSDNARTAGPNRCNSTVYKLISPGFEAMLMGDAQIPAEEDLIDSEFDISSDILKVGHHGHGPVNSLDFLDAVDPNIAIIDNAWPRERRDDKVLECKSKLGYLDTLDVYETNNQGSIVVESFKNTYAIKSSITRLEETTS